MLVEELLMPLAEKTITNANEFEKAVKEEMFDDLQYVQSLEKELDELQSDKTEFSNEYDLLLQECLSKDILCAALIWFGNDQFAPILGYGDLVQGNIMIKGLIQRKPNHNLFSVGQFCDADLEVAFWKYTCFVKDLQGNDLLTGNHRSDLYTISLKETSSLTPICFMSKASPTQAYYGIEDFLILTFRHPSTCFPRRIL
ncbi:hypothetical protein Tco_0935893 [Tanacetum coccineum]